MKNSTVLTKQELNSMDSNEKEAQAQQDLKSNQKLPEHWIQTNIVLCFKDLLCSQ